MILRNALVKNSFIYLVSRIIKIVANISKFLCYGFHFLLPKKRFTLPRQARPILRKRKQALIPAILWQTNYTDRVTLPVYLNYLFNRLLSYNFEYRFMITQDRADFIKEHYPPEIYQSYSRLQIGAAQADLWRLLVLQKYGGTYMDIDAHLVWPLSSIIKPGYEELYLTIRNGEISNYFIASKNNNPHLAQMIDIVLKNIEDDSIRNVYDLTGPAVFNQVLDKSTVNTMQYRYICNQGNFTNEYFQYIDKPEGKWTHAQKQIDIVKK
jgi:mannosyltransferase OCH1-like enzyme